MATDGGELRHGLLVDYGGVLTTDVFSSFTAFCQAEGLEPDLVRAPLPLAIPRRGELLFELEVGRLSEQDFEPRFAAVIGVAEPAGLIDRLFAGMRPDYAMVNAVRAAKDAGVRTGLISNSWGKGRYDRSQFPELFDGVVISGEVGHAQARAAHLRAGRRGDRAAAGGLRVRGRPAAATSSPPASWAWPRCTTPAPSETIPQLERLLGVRLR